MTDWEEHDRHRRSSPPRDGLSRMAAALGIRSSVARVRRLGGGLASATHLVTFASGVSVVTKRYPPGTESVEAEWERLCFAHGAGALAPDPLGVDLHGEWFGCPTIAMARVPGRSDLAPTNHDRYAAQVVAAVAHLRTIDVARADGSLTQPHPLDFRDPPEVAPPGLLSAKLAQRALDVLVTRMPFTDGRRTTLNHCDFHPGNLMWSRGRVTAIIDWSNARVGYPTWDIATFTTEAELLGGAELGTTIDRRAQAELGEADKLLTLRLRAAFGAHMSAHRWLIAWHEQRRRDLTEAVIASRLSTMTRRLLADLG